MLTSLIVKFYRRWQVVFPLATLLLMPAAILEAMACCCSPAIIMATGPVIALDCASVVIISFVLLVGEVLADVGGVLVVAVHDVTAAMHMALIIVLFSSV